MRGNNKKSSTKNTAPVAFQGDPGAFSQQAIRQFLGDAAQILPCQRFEQVFRALEADQASAAAIPIENTLHGSVHENFDHLLNFDFAIAAETNVRIVHNLIAIPGTTFGKVKRVYSHPVALNQCLDFFAANPQVEREPFYDTAGSVKMIVEQGLKDAGAIASALAAEIYGARILKRSIEDDRRNYTRFFLLHKRGTPAPPLASPPSREHKTTIVFTTRNIPGALFRALSAFALRDLNLAKIESRPLRGKPWEYLFYLDLIGDVSEVRLQKAIGHLEELADFMRVLGSYPAVGG
ncbi:MAG: prephenate dehydratase [Acidobacteria bacterium]|nr:prephenate dehydratase [Acidobacteriota bacterium]